MKGTSGADSAARAQVLLVEDDPSMRRSMQLLLQGRGFDIRAYASPDAMLRQDRIHDAALLLIDYRLGARDGIEVLEALRATGWTGSAILVTAFPTAELRRAAVAAGFVSVLEKPFPEQALVNMAVALTRAPPSGVRKSAGD